MHSKSLGAVLASLALATAFPVLADGEEPIVRPHLDQTAGARSITLHGQTFINEGLVGSGQLPAGTVDFLGDTLGSFSSLQVAPGSWKRVGDHYEGVLWTLPDRGRNDPGANLFFEYPARLERFRIRFTPGDGRLEMQVDGGLRLKDYRGQPFTGADPDGGILTEKGLQLPAPKKGTGAGKVSFDAESLQFTRDGHFYIGDEYTANVYYFSPDGRLRGVIIPPASVAPRLKGKPYFGSLTAPDTGRRNNQGVEGMSLSPDGRTLFVVLQSALIQDSAKGNAAGRRNTRVLVYDVSRSPTPSQPVAHHVVQLPVYDEKGEGGAPDRTAAQSEVRALDDHRFLMLARDGAGFGAAGNAPIMYKSVLLVDLAGATNLTGTAYERDTASILQDPVKATLRSDIKPAETAELVNLLNPSQLARAGLTIDRMSEKWEAMDLLPVLDPEYPSDYFLLVANDNDFIARHCRMSGQSCDSDIDNDNRVLIYRLRLPEPLALPSTGGGS